MTIEKLIEKIHHLKWYQFDEHLKVAEEILKKDKDNQIALGYKSYALFHLEKYSESFEVLDYALNLYPNNGYLIYNKLDFLLELNRIEEAYEFYSKNKSKIAEQFRQDYQSKIAIGFEKMLEANPDDFDLIDNVKNFSHEFNIEVKYDEKYYISWIQAIKGIGDESSCPLCGEKLIPIAYGYPSEEMMKAAEEGRIVLGGCCIPLNPKHYLCPKCSQSYTKSTSRLIIDNTDKCQAEYALKKLDELELFLDLSVIDFYYGFADKKEYDEFISRLIEVGMLQKGKDGELEKR